MNDKKQYLEKGERRRYLRFLVHFKAEVYFQNQTIPATVLDISEGGVGFMIPYKLSFYDELLVKVNLSFDGFEKTHVYFKGRVVWIENSNINDKYVGGLEIIDISHHEFKTFRELLEALAFQENIEYRLEEMS